MRITHGMVQRNVLTDINRAATDVAKLQSQMSSGKQRTAASDDPAGAARSARLTSSLAGTRALQSSVADAQSWTDSTESALATMSDVVNRAREQVIAGASGSATAASRAAIADEIDQLAESLKDAANASVGGQFLFGGTKTGSAPYSAATGDAYQGDSGSIAREIGVGVSVSVNLRSSDLLGSGGGDGKLLATLRDVSSHLRSGDATALGTTDLEALDTNRDELLSARAVNGALTKRLDAGAAQLLSFEEQTMGALSTIDDVDYAKASADFATRYTAYQAALKTGANVMQTSLLDFLN